MVGCIALGVTYRVAYLTGDESSFGDIPFLKCSVFYSQAMLYNPARLLHVPPPSSVATIRYDGHQDLVGTPHLRRSLPLCSRGTHFTPLETLIDGLPQTDRCGRPTPSGPAFTVFGSDTGHVSATHARFALVSDSSRVIDIFNVHPSARLEDKELPSILRLIDAIMPPPYAGSKALYPPLLSGDFNAFADGLNDKFPGFTKVVGAPPDVMAVAIGLANYFPSQLQARVARAIILPDRPTDVLCKDPRYLFSDHCGIFIRFDADGPDAGALRGVFLDGPDRAVSGEAFRLEATASGGSADLTFTWSPGGHTGPILYAQGGVAGQFETWTVTVTDHTSNQSRSASRSVRYVAPPSRAECQAACVSERDTCMREVARSDANSPQQCVEAFRDCQARCR
jgi:hypothetical protein